MSGINFLINSGYRYRRFPTREITIGSLKLGGANPVRIQSMVNTPPEDITGTFKQIEALAEAGCEMVRMAIPSVRDAERLPELTRLLSGAGVKVPLVADVHFNPAIAGICAKHLDKVRINPGNYCLPGRGRTSLWDRVAVMKELEDTDRLLQDLIRICVDHGTAIRIGVNHGSLSPRIMSQYGDTPEGMVESALEFIRIFNRHNFHELVVSMKSSNVRVMVMAYRLLVKRMIDEGFDYPVHLGVTEAGSGDEGRIKSAAGIGLLLDEGIGDTIRVSLTEDPVCEIPVAKQLLERYTRLSTFPENYSIPDSLPYDCFDFKKRETVCVSGTGGKEPVAVVGKKITGEVLQPDYITEFSEKVNGTNIRLKYGNITLPVVGHPFLKHNLITGKGPFAVMLPDKPDDIVAEKLQALNDFVAIIPVDLYAHPGVIRNWVQLLDKRGLKIPLIVKIDTSDRSREEVIINAAITASGFMTDGLADGIWIDSESIEDTADIAYMILQATRARITSTEYISCPSCGRTRFDIREAVQRIRERTSHLTGLKIAIMGCIVNGPGEMADADYGYVGAGNGTVNLYKGKKVLRKGVKEKEAIDSLIEIIDVNGDWKEPPVRNTKNG